MNSLPVVKGARTIQNISNDMLFESLKTKMVDVGPFFIGHWKWSYKGGKLFDDKLFGEIVRKYEKNERCIKKSL